jgi:hypothetical protein
VKSPTTTLKVVSPVAASSEVSAAARFSLCSPTGTGVFLRQIQANMWHQLRACRQAMP